MKKLFGIAVEIAVIGLVFYWVKKEVQKDPSQPLSLDKRDPLDLKGYRLAAKSFLGEVIDMGGAYLWKSTNNRLQD